jgi:hypothetical protein
MSRTTELASETHFAGPLWLREDVGAIYAKGEVHTGPFSMPLLRMADQDLRVSYLGKSYTGSTTVSYVGTDFTELISYPIRI